MKLVIEVKMFNQNWVESCIPNFWEDTSVGPKRPVQWTMMDYDQKEESVASPAHIRQRQNTRALG